MAGNRTLKLSILADVDNLNRSLRGASDDVETFGDKLGKFGKIAGAAFVAAGVAAAAYAGKLAVDGVKAAIEDEAAQEKLALTLKNVAGATDGAISSTEEWISKQGILYGITDDDLRPAIERMARATKDVTKAQELVSLAMDISAGTGKSLESVTNALGKAYEGSNTALGKLGLGIDKAQLKEMSFDEVTRVLANTFEGQAAAKAETFAGKLDRLQLAFNEGKETVGSYILDAITPLVTAFVEQVIPAIQNVATNFGGDGGLMPLLKSWGDWLVKNWTPLWNGLVSLFNKVRDTFKENQDELQPLYDLMRAFASWAAGTLAPFIMNVLGKAFSALGTIISVVVNTFAELVDWANKAYNAVKKVVDLARSVGSTVGGWFSGASLETTIAPVPSASGFVNASYGGTTNNITVNGAIDSEGTARTIVNVLNQSAARTGNYSNLGTSALSLVTA